MTPESAISWFEIPTHDLGRAKRFYEAILDWGLVDFSVGDGLKMALFPTEAGGVGGALIHHPDYYTPSHKGPLLYLNANPDLGRILARVDEAGGKILVPKTQISEEHGFMGILEDSEGNRIGLHSLE